ncbi:hypothetical protein ABT369_08225 [Dactylosporangium sp. NPDC000244]|uniref:hypothetical protein n=1 Tax=Dactylosporangium sp. NPDC000244 TaxID=3154365 RepID=UPI003329258D
MSPDVRAAYEEMLAAQVMPRLRDLGFGADLRRDTPGEGTVAIGFAGERATFPGQVAFAIEVRAATGRWVSYARETGADEPAQIWGRVAPPAGFGFHLGSDDWNLRTAADAPGYGAQIARLLGDVVVPGIERHLELNAALERAFADGEAVAAFGPPPALPGIINRMSYAEPDDPYVAWLRAGAVHTGPPSGVTPSRRRSG